MHNTNLAQACQNFISHFASVDGNHDVFLQELKVPFIFHESIAYTSFCGDEGIMRIETHAKGSWLTMEVQSDDGYVEGDGGRYGYRLGLRAEDLDDLQPDFENFCNIYGMDENALENRLLYRFIEMLRQEDKDTVHGMFVPDPVHMYVSITNSHFHILYSLDRVSGYAA